MRLEAILPARLSHALAGFVQTFTQGLAVMRQPGRLLVSLAAVVSALAVDRGRDLADIAGLSYYVSRITASFLVMAVLVVGVAVPTPGAIGGFHAAYEFAVGHVLRRAAGSGGRRRLRAARDFVRAGHDSGSDVHGERGADAGQRAGDRRVGLDRRDAAGRADTPATGRPPRRASPPPAKRGAR